MLYRTSGGAAAGHHCGGVCRPTAAVITRIFRITNPAGAGKQLLRLPHQLSSADCALDSREALLKGGTLRPGDWCPAIRTRASLITAVRQTGETQDAERRRQAQAGRRWMSWWRGSRRVRPGRTPRNRAVAPARPANT